MAVASSNLRIRLVANPPGLEIRAGRRAKEVSLPGLRRLPSIRQRIPDLLRGVRQAVGLEGVKLSDDYGQVQRALLELDVCADSIGEEWLRGTEPRKAVADLENELAEFISPALHTAGETPIIELIPLSKEDRAELGFDQSFEDWSLPLEFMRIAEPSTRSAASASPDRRLRRFLGMRAIIVRRRREPSGSPAIGTGRVPIAVLAYDGSLLKGPQRQAVFFRGHRDVFADSHWPAGQTFPLERTLTSRPPPYVETSVAAGLADQILNAATFGRTKAEAYTGAILHFTCHYSSKAIPGLDQSAPFLSFDEFRKNVSVGRLEGTISHVYQTRKDGQAPPTPGAYFAKMFVFINACESASNDPLDAGMLSMLFDKGFRHVVASETLIPDGLASEFSDRFYIALRRGLTLAEALLQARRDLVERCDNPGGLFYTLYGDPGIKLALT